MMVRLIGPPEADGEYIALPGESPSEQVVHLHDYARIYQVPGLYEHVVQGLLKCRSPQVAVGGLESALARLGRDPAETVLLDIGAGTGIVGELVREIGVVDVIGLDSLPAARAACLRDRPQIYRDYLVGDIAAASPTLITRVRGHVPNALISAGAFGGTHAPPAALVNAVDLLKGGAPVVFTIDERWMRTTSADGFPAVVDRLFDSGALRRMSRTRFRHRESTTGAPIHYELVVAVKSE